ncbi:MAG: EthD family reductase, partial [Woeseiaceae bacterium]|nr:EthD family reductase [Woeseiaceae bacterium]
LEEFRNYWRNQHAGIIAKLPGVQRYVQSHPLDDESP